MKTYSNTYRPVKQYALIGAIVLIVLFGLSLNGKAQSTLVGNDTDQINNAMVVQLADYDFDIIIPKVKTEELESLSEVVFNQLVYVTDKKGGYYSYMGAEWEMQNIIEVFELIDTNLAIQEPNLETLIMTLGEDSRPLLDYNKHIKDIYHNFVFDKEENSMAVLIEKD